MSSEAETRAPSPPYEHPALPPASAPVAAAAPRPQREVRDPGQGGGVATSGLLWGAATVACWAGYNVASKAGIDAGFAPVDLGLLRFCVAGLVLVPLLLVLRGRWRGRLPGWRRTAVLTLLGGPLFSLLAVSGYQFAPLTHGILFAPAANFLVGSALGVFWLGERVGRRHLVGGAIMLIGLVVLSGVDAATLGPGTLKGDILFICTGATWALFTVMMRRWRVDPVAGVLAQGSLSCLLAPVPWLALGGGALLSMPVREVAVQAVMQGAVGGLLASFAYFAAVSAMGAARASLLGPMVPGTALAMASAMTLDPPRWVDASGVALVTAGLLVATLRRARRA